MHFLGFQHLPWAYSIPLVKDQSIFMKFTRISFKKYLLIENVLKTFLDISNFILLLTEDESALIVAQQITFWGLVAYDLVAYKKVYFTFFHQNPINDDVETNTYVEILHRKEISRVYESRNVLDVNYCCKALHLRCLREEHHFIRTYLKSQWPTNMVGDFLNLFLFLCALYFNFIYI